MDEAGFDIVARLANDVCELTASKMAWYIVD
jgi:hypothetical protein